MHILVHTLTDPPIPWRSRLRTTVTLDVQLLEEARRLAGIRERTALIREGLKALIERESARRLARLGGSEPEMDAPPRRRSAPK